MDLQKKSLVKIMLFKFFALLLNHPLTKSFEKKHPKTFLFLINRFSPKMFWGLPFTLLIASLFANVFMLSEVIEEFENSTLLLFIDNTIANFLFKHRIVSIANVFYWFTKLGSLQIIISIAIVTSILFLLKNKFIYSVAISISLVGTGLTVWVGKNYFHRIRPIDLSFYQEFSYSFPSGHSTIAISFYGIIFYFLIKNAKTYSVKIYWIITAIAFITLLGFSRLYLGVHFFSDVIAGYLLGMLWLLLSISIIEMKNYKTNK